MPKKEKKQTEEIKIELTETQIQEFKDLAFECVRDDKKEQMYAIVQEVESAYNNGELTQRFLKDKGKEMLSLVKVLKWAYFIRKAKSLAKENNISAE